MNIMDLLLHGGLVLCLLFLFAGMLLGVFGRKLFLFLGELLLNQAFEKEDLVHWQRENVDSYNNIAIIMGISLFLFFLSIGIVFFIYIIP